MIHEKLHVYAFPRPSQTTPAWFPSEICVSKSWTRSGVSSLYVPHLSYCTHLVHINIVYMYVCKSVYMEHYSTQLYSILHPPSPGMVIIIVIPTHFQYKNIFPTKGATTYRMHNMHPALQDYVMNASINYN